MCPLPCFLNGQGGQGTANGFWKGFNLKPFLAFFEP
jgi:hypothetical protein